MPHAVAYGQTVTFTAPATITATATDRVGLVATAQQAIGAPAPATLTPFPNNDAEPPVTRRVPVRVADRRGRVKGRAELAVTTAGADRTARLVLGRVRAPKGTWRIRVCLRQPGRRAACRTSTARLRRAGRLPALAVSAAVAAGPVQAAVTIARKRGARYAKPVVSARASAA